MNKIKGLILILAITAGLGVSFAASDTLLVNTAATAQTHQAASYLTCLLYTSPSPRDS